MQKDHAGHAAPGGRGIVCGLGQVGYRVAMLALQAGHRVTIVTAGVRPEWQRDVTAAGAEVVHGDARDEHVLVSAGLHQADWIISATANDLTNIEIALDAKRICPNVRTVARVFDQNLARQLEAAFGIDRVLAMSSLAAPAFISAAFGDQLVANFKWGEERFGVLRVVVTPEHPFVGRTLAEVETTSGMSPLLLAAGEAEPLLLPDRGHRLSEGDAVEFVGNERAIQAIGSLPRPRTPQKRSPATRAHVKRNKAPRRRPWRHLWRKAPRELRLLLLGLLALIFLSTLVFKIGMGLSAVDSFYFVVSTVTTTGYGDITPKYSAVWIKLFTCLVMLLGSAAVATLYSIITDALISARLQELTVGPPVPEDGHVIVVGLGNVGFRTCEELLRLGAQPVGIDLHADAKLVTTLRTQMPVVRGDAREAEVLQQANLATASAVIVCTSDDSVNLAVGLMVREAPGRRRIVLRIFDDGFARKVQTTLTFDGALSAPAVAAPAFVGSAAYPSSLASFIIRGRLMTLFGRNPSEAALAEARGEAIVFTRADGVELSVISRVIQTLGDNSPA